MFNKVIAAGVVLAASCSLTYSFTDIRWENKWLKRDVAEGLLREKHASDVGDIEHKYAIKFADINDQYINLMEKNRSDADQTIAAYRAGNIKLRKQLTCTLGYVSDSSTVGPITSGTNPCGLQGRDVEFLVRYSERAQAINIKLKKAQDILKVIYGEKK